MSTLSLTFVYQPFTRSVNTGSSPESRTLEKWVTEVCHHFRRRAERDKAFNELARVVEQMGEDWDGYGGVKAAPGVSPLACRFLNTLPSSLPTPEVGVDPDGDISFEWFVSKDRQLVASLSPDGMLNYAAVFGVATKRGLEEFDDSVPNEVIEAIRRLGPGA
jgi:hypothetical protein